MSLPFRCFRVLQVIRSGNALRFHAAYGAKALSHEDMTARFGSHTVNRDELALLEETEKCIAKWRLNKWEFRIPPLLNPAEREKVMLQQDILKSFCLNQADERKHVLHDIEIVVSLTGISADSVREKTRAWLQEEASKLRWKGEVNKAKELRDAFLRLEVYGSRDYRLLDRICCMYGLGMQGTFDEAFNNIIVQDPSTGKLSVDESNPFVELQAYIISRYPQIDIIHDFLGFNIVSGYRSSLSRFLVQCLAAKNNLTNPVSNSRVLLQVNASKEVLFDFGDSRGQIAQDDSVYGLPDFMYVRGSDIFLITIAAESHWLRKRQVPHAKQLEGIARRGSFVLGIPFEKVRIRNVLLPPNYVDAASLRRLTENVLEMAPDVVTKTAPWSSLYEKELDTKDVDYCELERTVNEEEWLTL
ncbi:putative mitochondrial hypothetical protein [Leptomonas pyrrhocoris]|uniref:Uncharacterized protein n=1 Tax=Leptomonas pyrrhocoris TaxID=157538 RepID=A0A0M9G6R7_LEPPY|nr:putative mitochondrial hypothetical protein [Leptomonas pyrrhocoris]KPA83446.1 putative mitochondrial hypothetical protein [Leptomonas pyrrhocoris]|eukprot:XP_015661885.1 putative mitochondrial hypothetical protein [Leptomonas pyrrhocoris]